MVRGYIIIVHLLFKELRSLFGKLLVSMCADVIALLLMHHWIIVNSECLQNYLLLTHLAYIMYCCYNLKPKKITISVQMLPILLFFVIITYNLGTGNSRYIHSYQIPTVIILINIPTTHYSLVAKLLLFKSLMILAYLVYFYKFHVSTRAGDAHIFNI